MKKGITVVCGGYNEEKRADAFFRSVSMFDRVIFMNRGCTDTTVEIARKYGADIFDVPFMIPEEEHLIVQKVSSAVYNMVDTEWVIALTFADIVHPQLYRKLMNVISREGFDYTVINVPWVEYLFGMEDEYIPRCHYHRPVLRRTEMVQQGLVTHKELSVKKKKEYTMKKNKRIAVHHMTYFNLQYSFKEQHVRYGKKEVMTYYGEQKHPKRAVLKELLSEVQNDMERIDEGKAHNRSKEVMKCAKMICLYRSIEYYLGIYLLLWAEERKVDIEKFFENIYECLGKDNIKTAGFNKVMVDSLIRIPRGTAEDIVALFAELLIIVIMKRMYVWNSERNEKVEVTYEKMKDKILRDR